MAQLTWRDIAAPNVGGSVRDFTDAGRMLQDSIGKAFSTVTDFDKAQSDQAQKDLELFIAQNPDAAALEQMLKTGAIPGMANRRGRNAATELLSPAKINAMLAAQQTRANSTKTFNQGNALDRMAGSLAMDHDLRNGGHRQEADELRATLDFDAIGYDNTAAVLGRGDGQDRSAFVDLNARRNLSESQAAVALKESIKASGATDPRDIAFLLDKSGASPAVAAAVRADFGLGNLGQATGNAGGANPSATIAAAVGGGAPVNNYAGSGSAKAVSDVANSLGISAEDLATVISYETGGKFDPDIMGGKGGNYQGLIQFGPAERAKYGVKPGMTFEQQMVAVGSFLKDRGLKPGSGMLDIYSTINAGTPGRYNASDGNGTVRSHVAKMEAEHRQGARTFLAAQNQDVKSALQLNTASSLAPAFDLAFNDDRDTNAIATELFGTGGFNGKGMDVGAVVGKLNEIQAEGLKAGYPIKPAVAAAILKNSIAEENLAEKFFWGQSLGNGMKLDKRKVEGYIDQLASGSIKRDATNREVISQNESVFLLANQRVAQAQQRVLQLEQAARNMPNGFKPELLARAREDLALEQQALQQASSARGNLPDMITSTNPTAPRPQPVVVSRPVTLGKGAGPAPHSGWGQAQKQSNWGSWFPQK